MQSASTQRAISTLAGTGEPGYAGDGGPAVHAMLNEPKHVACAADGTVYVSDSENHVIRRIDPVTGFITTVAGRSAEPSPSGRAETRPTAVPQTEEDPFASEPASTGQYVSVSDLSGTVRFVVGSAGTRFGGDGGPAVDALLNFPSAVAVDEAGHLYIADTMNHRVRKVDAATGRISTVAGTGHKRCAGDGGPAAAAALNEPTALAAGQGRLYIADQGNHRVRCIDLGAGTISTIAGTGESAYTGDGMAATEAALAGPSGLAIGPSGELYIADTFNGRIRRVDPHTGTISTVVGDGASYRYQGADVDESTSLSRPYGIAVEPNGDLLITDSDSHLIRRWERAASRIVRVAGSGAPGFAGDGGSAGESALNYPFGVAVNARGAVYIADTFNHRIRVIAG